jgi:hypothetical protein
MIRGFFNTNLASYGHGRGDCRDPDAQRLHRLKGQGGDERVRDERGPTGTDVIKLFSL